jgi:hypothetical protein
MFIERVCEKITNYCKFLNNLCVFVNLKCYKRVGCKSVFTQEVTMRWGMSCRYESNF